MTYYSNNMKNKILTTVICIDKSSAIQQISGVLISTNQYIEYLWSDIQYLCDKVVVMIVVKRKKKVKAFYI